MSSRLTLVSRVFKPVRAGIISRQVTLSYLQSARMSDKSSLDKEGSVGSAFKADGSVGGKAQAVGGPFDKQGAVGKQFNPDGAVGGTAQDVAEQAQGDKPSMFDAKGAIGKQFTTEGAVGGTAQAVGGPLAADGVIGKQFTQDGAIGGTVQENLGDKK